jgi:transcriptional regulator with XRE-family HTH domain
VVLTTKRPKSAKFPNSIVTIGDHIRTRRLELGLLQKDVAVTIGVDTCTITNWEKNRSSPQLHLLPGVVRFLGYSPFIVNEGGELGERIRLYRKSLGITQKKLAKDLGIDPTTLARWEKGSFNTKGERTRDAIAQLLSMSS